MWTNGSGTRSTISEPTRRADPNIGCASSPFHFAVVFLSPFLSRFYIFLVHFVAFSFSCAQVIRWFWRCVRELSHAQHRKLLRFVTAVDRPPLSGFAHLNPPFAIRLVPFVSAPSNDERSFWDKVKDAFGDKSAPTAGTLPSAATCFNMVCAETSDDAFSVCCLSGDIHRPRI